MHAARAVAIGLAALHLADSIEVRFMAGLAGSGWARVPTSLYWVRGGNPLAPHGARRRRDPPGSTPYLIPTCPRTEAISASGSYPTPSRNTIRTLRISSGRRIGLPSITTMSASLPSSIEP